MVSVGLIVVVVIAVLVVYLIMVYNGLVRMRNQVENGWAQIDVQLKKRTDLVPNLIETVKGYAKHERQLLTEITKARTSFMRARGVEAKSKASNMLSESLKSLFAVSENYPDLKANQNFLQLQEELSGIENKIAYARQFYNDVVMSYNTRIQTFPTTLFASGLGFNKREFFAVPEGEKAVPKVSF